MILCDGAFQRHGRASRVVNAEQRLHACDLGSGIVPWDLIEGKPAEEAEDLAELDRLLYVSLTRARDLLAAPVPDGDFPRDSLLAPVAAGLKRLGAQGGRIAPRPTEPGSADVSANRQRGNPLWDLLRKDTADGVPEEGITAEAAFLARRTRALEEGRAPNRVVASATALAADEAEGEAAEVHRLPTDPERPGGIAFGELVHRVLERIPLDAAEAAVRREAIRASRELERSEEFAAAAASAVLGALGHPLLAEARRAEEHGACYRELPLLHFEQVAGPNAGNVKASEKFETASVLNVEGSDEGTLPVESGPILVEGVADLVFQTESAGVWTVVDFKTDFRPPDDPGFQDSQARYRRQVSLYARAVERATGQPAKAVLLYV